MYAFEHSAYMHYWCEISYTDVLLKVKLILKSLERNYGGEISNRELSDRWAKLMV